MYASKKFGRPKNIAILRALPLGDMLTAVPAFRALRAALPDARITLISQPWASDFVKRFSAYLDDFIPFPGFPGLSEETANVRLFPSFINTVQKLNFDLAIQMQSSGEIANSLISLWGVKANAGFYLPGSYCPDENLFLPYPEHETDVRRQLRLMESLGIPMRGEELEFPLYQADWESLQRIRESFNLYQNYVCICPGESEPDRRWPVSMFVDLADGLAALGYKIVLAGSEQDTDVTGAIASCTEMPPINLAGTTDLGALAALISQACLVVSGDAGIARLASAVKTPSLVLCAAPDANGLAPLDGRRHEVIETSPGVSSSEVFIQAIKHLQKVGEYV